MCLSIYVPVCLSVLLPSKLKEGISWNSSSTDVWRELYWELIICEIGTKQFICIYMYIYWLYTHKQLTWYTHNMIHTHRWPTIHRQPYRQTHRQTDRQTVRHTSRCWSCSDIGSGRRWGGSWLSNCVFKERRLSKRYESCNLH